MRFNCKKTAGKLQRNGWATAGKRLENHGRAVWERAWEPAQWGSQNPAFLAGCCLGRRILSILRLFFGSPHGQRFSWVWRAAAAIERQPWSSGIDGLGGCWPRSLVGWTASFGNGAALGRVLLLKRVQASA
jgi:hypothetical protein